MLKSFKTAFDSNEGGWLVTFSDLMTLLFCFFVLLTIISIQPKNCGQLVEYMNKNFDYYRGFEVRSNKKECIISLPSDFLFVSGSASLQRKNIRKLNPLFKKILTLEEHREDLILIDGHTDNVRIRTKKYQNNWELSSARATNFATYLIYNINYDRARLSVRSFGESRPREQYSDIHGQKLKGKNLRETRRKNRRVDLVLAERPEDYDLINLLFDGKDIR